MNRMFLSLSGIRYKRSDYSGENVFNISFSYVFIHEFKMADKGKWLAWRYGVDFDIFKMMFKMDKSKEKLNENNPNRSDDAPYIQISSRK